ncbi:MAG: competence protein ComEC [Oleispira sp.]|jgi:competence protein ComEC
MRLCLVSAILALFVSIQFQSEQYWLLVLLVLAVFVGARSYSWQIRSVAVLCALLSACYSHFWLLERLEGRLSADLSGLVVTGYGEVVGCSDAGKEVEKLLLRIVSLSPAEQLLPPLKQVELSFYRRANNKTSNKDAESLAAKISCGSLITFTAKLRAPYSFINPWGFDYEAWQLSRGVDASGYLLKHEVVGIAQGWRSQLIVLREQWIQRAASLKGVAGQLVPALLFGEAGYLPKQQWLDFQLTGTIHLLIVSGLHVGFLIFMVTSLWYLLMRLEVLLFFPRSSILFKLTPIVLLLACAIYAYMAGMGLAIQRAGLMLGFGICVVYFRHHWSLFDTWLWVVLLVLLVNPLSILFIGFWFSFAAVGALLLSYVGQVGNRSLAFDTSAEKGLGQLIVKVFEKVKLFYQPQWIVFVALMPLLWLFQQPQSALSFFTNIIAIPLLGFVVMPLAMIAFIWPEGIAVGVLNAVLGHALAFLHQLSLLPSWLIYKPTGVWLLLLFPLIFLTLWLPGAPFKRLSLLLLVCVFFLPMRGSDKKLIIFDVGQGLSVYGSSSERTWLYDTGAQFRSGFSLGDAVVAKNILAFNGRALDLLFVSHSDNDHAGGELGLRRKIIPTHTYAGQPRLQQHKNCHAVSGWKPLGRAEGVGEEDRWRIFPYRVANASDNNQSCIVQVEMAGKRILLPGDIDKKAERALLAQYGSELTSDVLIVGHHGSKTSSSDEWLAQVAPKVAVVSSGFNNRFHHPHNSVRERFKQHSIALYNTADSGAIEINLAEIMSVTQWRHENAPVWRQIWQQM